MVGNIAQRLQLPPRRCPSDNAGVRDAGTEPGAGAVAHCAEDGRRARSLPNDHGGHYIGRRFNGPTDAFNHFAQDAKFNVGAYRALEDEWAAAIRRGEKVSVVITPGYLGTSSRPVTIDVRYRVGTEAAVVSSFENPSGYGREVNANVDIGPYLAEIGEIAVHHIQREPDGILIFAEAQPGVVSCSIFHDEGNLVRYRDCSRELFEKIREIWRMEDEPLRWTTMSYRIDGGRFDVEFGFDPPPPPGEMGRPRREALLRRFGEKPVDDSEPD